MIMQKISLVVVLCLALAGCGSAVGAGQELDTKSEYSVLQGLEFDYRYRKQDQPYILERNALSSGYDLIGLPKADSENGYVWLIANPSSEPAVKKVPSDVEFLIGKDALAAIEQSVRLTPAVRSYLLARVRHKH